MSNGIKIVFINRHTENLIAETVCKHCHLLIANNLVHEVWHKGLINPGEDIDRTILTKVIEANILIFILTADFLADEKYADLIRFVEDLYFKGGKVEIYLILANYCDWKNHKFLKRFRVLPHSEKPIQSSKWETKDMPYNLITEAIELNTKRVKLRAISIINRNMTFGDYLKLSNQNKLNLLKLSYKKWSSKLPVNFLTNLYKGWVLIWFVFIMLSLSQQLSNNKAIIYGFISTFVFLIVMSIKDIAKERMKAFLASSYFGTVSSDVIKDSIYSYVKRKIFDWIRRR